MTPTITEHKKAVTVKNARLFYDHKRIAFRLVHYQTEILTIKCKLVAGNKIVEEIVQINPVSDSSKRAIQEAFFYIYGEFKNIDVVCRELNTNRNELSKEFWGFDAFKRYQNYNSGRPSTFIESQGNMQRFNKSDWLEVMEYLESNDLPGQKVISIANK